MSYTTRLLADIDRAMPRRHQLVLLGVILWVVAGAIVGSLGRRGGDTVAPPAAILIVTATPRQVEGRAAPPEKPEAPTMTEEPTEAPAVVYATVEVPVTVYVERAAEPAQEEETQAAPTPTLDWYSDIPAAPPEIVALCQTEKAKSSWVCGGKP